MPPFSTPFRVPPSRPNSSSRPGTGPQFASTPRFLLSQQTPTSKALHDVNDSIDPGSSPQPTPIRPANSRFGPGATQRQCDLIEDSDEQLDHDVPSEEPHSGTKKSREEIDSSPPDNAPELDAEFEALFGPTADRIKRRRVSPDAGAPITQRQRPGADLIESSPPGPPSPPLQTPLRRYEDAIPQRTVAAVTTNTPHTSTPGSSRPPFRGQPRFMLSASQAPPSSQVHANIGPYATPVPSSTPARRKLGFVLPQPPSPTEADNEAAIIPPFSPSSRALRRRGRPRSTAPAYLPGGMASDVRSWVLEMGAKREQLQMNVAQTQATPSDLTKYQVVFSISEISQSSLGSSGPLSFVKGHEVNTSVDVNDRPSSRGFLLMGSPRNQPSTSPFQSDSTAQLPTLQVGNIIGIYPGLVWEVDLDEQGSQKYDNNDNQHIDKDSSAQRTARNCDKWLVGMDWETVS